MNEALYAPLTPSLVRRGSTTAHPPAIRLTLSSSLADDVRLFAVTWAAGFAFFLAYLL